MEAAVAKVKELVAGGTNKLVAVLNVYAEYHVNAAALLAAVE